MNVQIKEIPTGIFELTEDFDWHCTHEGYIVYYEAGGDGITEPRGGWYIECPAWDCDGITDNEAENLIEAHTEAPDYE